VFVSSLCSANQTVHPDASQHRKTSMRLFLIALFVTLASPVMADGYTRVTDRGAFVDLVSGKSLTSLGVSLNVSPSGAITGRAFGRAVTGGWTWDTGFAAP
jgi:hypothetical protein